jgi:hypothetical protein
MSIEHHTLNIMDRREALRNIGATAVAPGAPRTAGERAGTKGRLKQSVSYWPYGRIPLAQFAAQAKRLSCPQSTCCSPNNGRSCGMRA